MTAMAETDWLLLIHQIPPKPGYLRVKIWRRLQRLGAVALKNSVYVLPRTDQSLEDFQWILRELRESGAEGTVVEGRFLEGITASQLEALFHSARDADYAEVAEEARRLLKARREDPVVLRAQLERLQARFAEIEAIDFFNAPGRLPTQGLLAEVERSLRPDPDDEEVAAPRLQPKELKDRTWVTRTGVHVDRIASAWLIRRFIDPGARFKFVPAKGYHRESGELRFDMFEAEFTHEGDRCTFEVLLHRLGIEDRALKHLGEIVHDLDFKDAKFERDEAAGIGQAVAGICLTEREDEARLVRGGELFNALYESFRRKRA
jgi:hypothetical protein